MTLEAPRLRLAPNARDFILALMENVELFERRSGLRAADGLRDFFVSGEISPAWVEKLRESAPVDVWLHGYWLLERESETAVGAVGFKGPPDADGMVEIGYGVVPSREGRGYATEAAAAVVAFAFAQPDVKTVRAHTLPKASAEFFSKTLWNPVARLSSSTARRARSSARRAITATTHGKARSRSAGRFSPGHTGAASSTAK